MPQFADGAAYTSGGLPGIDAGATLQKFTLAYGWHRYGFYDPSYGEDSINRWGHLWCFSDLSALKPF